MSETNEAFTPYTNENLPANLQASDALLETLNTAQVSPEAISAIVGAVAPKEPTPPAHEELTMDGLKAYVPEGGTLMEGISEGFLKMVNDNKLPKETIKAIVDYDFARQDLALKESQAQWDKQQDEWKAELEKDPIFAGKTVEQEINRLDQVIFDYGGTADANGLNGMQRLLDETGMASHPEFVRFIDRLEKVLPKEGKVAIGQSTQSKPKDPAQALFPNT